MTVIGSLPVSENLVYPGLLSSFRPSLKDQVEQILFYFLVVTLQDCLMASFRILLCDLSLTFFHRNVSQLVQHSGIVGTAPQKLLIIMFRERTIASAAV